MELLMQILVESWRIFEESSVYILFGIFVAGLLRVFLSPEAVARHLGEGRFRSVFKAALMGIPIPLCSCGVLPAAVSLKKQGANNGATTAFLISTPESGVDSIALTYALMDPIMTVARPVAAFVTAAGAGMAENLFSQEKGDGQVVPDLSCPVDNCCDGVDCLPAVHRSHHTFAEKLRAGMGFALRELWGDIAAWFFVGVLLAGIITVAFPSEVMARHLGGGLPSMLIMLALGIPLYICATASTPIAAAFILKGVSPGAALVFLLAGPATNVTSLTVLLKILGKRATAVYLVGIAVMTVACGMILDEIYGLWGISAQALAGRASEILPHGVEVTGALALVALSIKPFYAALRAGLMRLKGKAAVADSCCTSGTCGSAEKDIPGCHCHDSGAVSRDAQ
jgi:uncharacterized membrane protein YraQ (UPF0718 family)